MGVTNNPTKIIVHCSDSPDDRNVTSKEIRQWHLDRGWSDIGYHYVIRRDGVVEQGRDDSVKGAHTKGHNTGSLGICLVGRLKFTEEQIEQLVWLIDHLCDEYRMKSSDVFCHNEFTDNKTCPNFSGAMLRRLLWDRV